MHTRLKMLILLAPAANFQPAGLQTYQKEAGDPCQTGDHCGSNAYCGPNMSMGQSTCQCLSTHVEIRRKCLRIIYPGQSGCEHTEQCQAAFENARCMDSNCYCPPGMTAQGQTCRQGKILTNN